jgi:hypothetical protein
LKAFTGTDGGKLKKFKGEAFMFHTYKFKNLDNQSFDLKDPNNMVYFEELMQDGQYPFIARK